MASSAIVQLPPTPLDPDLIDKPLPIIAAPPLTAPPTFLETAVVVAAGPSTEPIRRISRLPPLPTLPWGTEPSRGPQRYMYIAVRRGIVPGVYTEWSIAEQQLIHHSDPYYKTFSTRLAAEAFVAGWNGAGRHSLPSSSPKPLREHLAMNFPAAVPTSPSRRLSYHARLLSPDAEEEFGFISTSTSTSTSRPQLLQTQSHRHSMVRVSSPLRQEVDDETPMVPRPIRKATSMVGLGGSLSPPLSPITGKESNRLSSVMDRSRPTRPRTNEFGPWQSSAHKPFPSPSKQLLSPPQTPPLSPPETSSSSSKSRKSGLWAETTFSSSTSSRSTTPSPLSPPPIPELELPGPSKLAPKFSRSSLKKSGVVMPVAAPRTNSSGSTASGTGSLKRLSSGNFFGGNGSTTSLNLWSNNSSTTSLSSSSTSARTIKREKSYYQDRLSTLAETTRKELQLNEEGLLALDALSPPRPAFMRRVGSNSSLGSNDSNGSMGSLTSATSSSAPPSSIESYPAIIEEQEPEVDVEVQISCTKSDGDADGSIESLSVKSGKIKKEKGKGGAGGLFKRFSKALKLEKKSIPGVEANRRPSM